jgi:anthranilate phosphoribosyltransferase
MSRTPFQEILLHLSEGGALSLGQADDAFGLIMDGAVPPAQIAAFLMGLHVRGETADEIAAGAAAMRARALAVTAPEGAVDTCGTGGDGKNTYNISTAAAFVVAGAGVPVAKHGNKAASSKSGSSDVLAALGVALDVAPKGVERALKEAGIGFLWAARHHAAMRHVAPVRQELRIRTVFNLLGPLSNPAGVARQMVGVADPKFLDLMAGALRRLGARRAWVVHGAGGLDEVSTTGESDVVEVTPEGLRRFRVSPEEAGLPRAGLADLEGGTAEENAAAIRAVLAGEKGAYRDIVLMNAAATLVIADRAADLAEGVARARESIDSGAAARALDTLIAVSAAEAGTAPSA